MNASLFGNCSAGPDAFDPDIAGIGVVVSFFTTALVAIFSVLAAYLMGSLPGVRHKDVDFLLIDFIRQRSPWRYSRFDTKTALQRGRRFETCFEKLLMPLADQQLVTSLAITIAAYSKWNEISLYSLEVASTLATISLVTHMTTIRYCPNYLKEHRLLGAVRAIAVFIVLSGFISLTIILEYAQLQALGSAVSMDGHSAAAIAWEMQPACIFSQHIQTPPGLVLHIFWSIAALTYYVNILSKLRSRTGRIHASSFACRTVLRLFRRKSANFDDFRNLHESRLEWISTVIPRPLQGLCHHLADIEAAYLAIKTSVSADIPWLFFVLIYCIAQLKTVWLDSDSPFWDHATESASLGFGQLTALILLAVPLLAGVDAFLSAKPTTREVARSTAEREQDDIEAGPGNEHPPAIVVHSSDLPIPIEDEPEIEPAPSRHLGDLDNKPNPDQLLPMETDEGTVAVDIQPGLDSLLERGWFRKFLYILCGWNMAVLIYAAIITGGPWEGEDINLSAISLIASLFGWEVLLELWNLFHVVWQELLSVIRRVSSNGRDEVTGYGTIQQGVHQHAAHPRPLFIDLHIPDPCLDLRLPEKSRQFCVQICRHDEFDSEETIRGLT